MDVDEGFCQSDDASELPEFIEFARGIKCGSSGVGADCAAVGVDPALRCVLNCGLPRPSLPGVEGCETEADTDLERMPRQIAMDKRAVAALRGARAIFCIAVEATDAARWPTDEEAGDDPAMS